MPKLHQHFNRAPTGEQHDHSFVNGSGNIVEYTHTHPDAISHSNPPIAHPDTHADRDAQPDLDCDCDEYGHINVNGRPHKHAHP